MDDQWWSVDDDDYALLYEHAVRERVSTVLEFGPGRSTLAFASAGARVVTYESEEHWLPQLVREFAPHGDRIELRSYSNGPVLDLPELEGERFDVALVDGPSGGDGAPHYNRRNSMRVAAAHAHAVFLHDTKRPREAELVRQMESAGWRVTELPSSKGLALLEWHAGEDDVGRFSWF